MPQLSTSEKTNTASNRPIIAACLSALFMGAGQLYNRQYIKGFLYFLVECFVLLFFIKPFSYGLWGLVTLGEKPQIVKGIRVVQQGDHSIFLMVQGLLLLLIALIILMLYVFQIRDAYRVGKKISTGGEPDSFFDELKKIWHKGFPYILIFPTVFFLFFLILFPLLFSVLIAFTNYSSPDHIPPRNLVDWVGFENFLKIIQLDGWENTFLGVFTWTITWAISATISVMFMGLIVAVLINYKGVRGKAFWRSIIILPWAIPAYVSLLIFRNLYNGQFGPINNMLVAMGFERIPWLSDPFWAKIAVLLANLWLGFPFWMAYMTAVLTNIDRDLYEAAEVDGANAFQQFWKITFPIVLTTSYPLMIFTFAFNFNNFNVMFLLTEGNPANVNYSYAGHTDILITWLYKLTLNNGLYNMAGVISIIIFIVVASISIYNIRRTKSFREVS